MSSLGRCIVVDDINKICSDLVNHDNFGLTGLQFGVNPTSISLSSPDLTEKNVKLILEQILNKQIYLIFHGKYVYNFCRRDVENQIESLVREINWACQLRCDVIIHQGKNVDSENLTKLQAINNYVKNISDVIDRTFDCDTMILLENSAGQGSELGFTLDELAYIYNQFDISVKERIGFCIDTCHIFVAGELDIRRKDKVMDFFVKFDNLIGLDKLKCIHFNDSGVPFGSKRDLHGDIMGGYISNKLLGGSPEGLQYIALFAHERHLPLIFETPCILTDTLPSQITFQYHIVEQWINQLPISAIDQCTIDQISQLSSVYYNGKNKRKISLKK